MKYIADHRDELRQTPAGLFVVARAHASAELAGLLFEIGWHPLRVASFPRIGRIEYWRDPHRHDSADRRVANAFAAELATLVASSRAAAAAVPAVLAPARSPAQPLREGPDLDLPVPLHWPLG